MSSVIFHPPPLYFLGWGLPLTQELFNSAQLAGQPVNPRESFASLPTPNPVLGLQVCSSASPGCEDPNSGPHACVTGTLLSEPPPSPLKAYT